MAQAGQERVGGPRMRVVAVLWWAVVGALAAFSVAAMLTVGVLVLPVAVVLGAVGLLLPRLRTGVLPGLLLGGSTVPFLIAWLDRSGPGVVCSETPGGSECTDLWSPWPFVVVGVLMVAAGLLALRMTAPRPPLPTLVEPVAPGRS